MFLKRFLLLLFLFVMCCTLCGHAHTTTTSTFSQSTNSPAERIDEFFKPGEISDVLKPNGEKESKATTFTVNNIESIFLVSTDGVMAALAEVDISKSNEDNDFKYGLLAKYIETNTGNNWADDAVKSDTNSVKWKTQLGTEYKKKTNNRNVVKSSGITVKGDKMYYITVSNSTFKNDDASSSSATDGEKWHAQLVVGEVTATADKKGKKIKWTTKQFNDILKTNHNREQLKTKPRPKPPSDGFAFVTADEKIMFFMKGKAKKESGNDEKNVTAVFQLEEKNENKVELLHVESHENCYPSLFQWEGNIIMTPTFCPGTVDKQMKVFDVTGKTFTACNMSITRLQMFLEDKSNFVSAVIEGKSLLLFIQGKYEYAKGDIHLWVTDGTRVKDVGIIFNQISGRFYGFVLYTNNELFVLHQKYNSEGGKTQQGNKYDLTRLRELLTNIKTVITAWRSADDAVTKLYAGDATTLPGTKVTDGLFGFLSNGGETSKKEWKDEYLYVNATVKEGTKVKNGFRFEGKNNGAKWSVGKQRGEQPYNFIASGFTLVATVKIEKVLGLKGNSLLGVGLEDNKRVGLWCSNDNKWGMNNREDAASVVLGSEKCEEGKTYQVALRLQEEGVFAAYIDGKRLVVDSLKDTLKFGKSDNITHFYFGVDDGINNDVESYVTVMNVLLYNRPLTEGEIGKLKTPKELFGPRPPDDTAASGTKSQSRRESSAARHVCMWVWLLCLCCWVCVGHLLIF